jgi:hypothetical protein
MVKKDNRVIVSKTEDGIEVKALASNKADWYVTLYSMVGQELINKTISLEEGENLLLNSEMHPGSGSEILRITNELGEIIYSSVIIW